MRHLSVLALVALLGACAPEIGDDCSTNQDCGSGRICDLSQPGGYCTVRPCEDTTSCPDGSVCIHFENTESYCMLYCEGNGDCRDGYVCVRDVGPAAFCNAVDAPK
jgi:hypothetical protein